MKRCVKCEAEKPLTEFYLKDKVTNRLSGKCKVCHMDDVRIYRSQHLGYFRGIDKKRAMLPHRVEAREKWEAKFPERANARNVVANAIKYGRMQRQPCAICGEKAEAHHPDYTAPLDVVWLCSAHHKQAHALARAA